MKRSCPYCGLKLKGKELASHVFEVHEGGGLSFYCREGCARCCTDAGAPLELVLEDIERISRGLGVSCEEFFKRYGGVLWSNIAGTHSLIPSTGLPFPCKLLKDYRCTVYKIRPLHCRLFPERLYITPSPREFEPFHGSGYACVDAGVFVDEKRAVSVESLMEKDQDELLRTAEFFRNEEHIYELTPSQYKKIQRVFGDIPPGDLERNKMRREALEGLIPKKVKEEARRAFLLRLRRLDKKSKE